MSTLHNKSCLLLGEDYPAGHFTATVTSPPYKNKDGYSDALIAELSTRMLGATRDGGFLFLNFAHLTEDWARPYKVFDILAQHWRPLMTIIWVKSMVFPPLAKWSNEPKQVGHYTPIQGDNQLNNLFEYIFVFSKGEPFRAFDRWSAPNGVAFSDKNNMKRGTRGKHGDCHCSGNVWFVTYETKNGPKLHPYQFPDEIPERCFALAGMLPGESVLDPFAGSATTLVVADRMGLASAGYELDAGMFQTAQTRIAEARSISQSPSVLLPQSDTIRSDATTTVDSGSPESQPKEAQPG